MARSETTWRAGQSGNPGGRPPGRGYGMTRALRKVCERAETIDDDGNPVSNAMLAANLMWDWFLTGTAERDDGTVEQLRVMDRVRILESILRQIEPPRPDWDADERSGVEIDLEERKLMEQTCEALDDEELEQLTALLRKAAAIEAS